jgi:hypothetical protein
MNNEIDLKELEKKAFRSTHEDGLWDIFLGMIMIAMGVSGAMSNLGVEETLGILIFVALEVLAMAIMIVGKKYITVPRMGIIRPGPSRKKKLTKASIVLLISFIFGMLLLIIPTAIQSTGGEIARPWYFIAGIFALNVLLVLGLLAYYMDYDRLYIIAVLFAVTLPLREILSLYFVSPYIVLIAFGIPGAIVLVMGIFYLFRFLKKYPRPSAVAVSNGL